MMTPGTVLNNGLSSQVVSAQSNLNLKLQLMCNTWSLLTSQPLCMGLSFAQSVYTKKTNVFFTGTGCRLQYRILPYKYACLNKRAPDF